MSNLTFVKILFRKIKYIVHLFIFLYTCCFSSLSAQLFVDGNTGTFYRGKSYYSNRTRYQLSSSSTLKPSISYSINLGYKFNKGRIAIGYNEYWLNTVEEISYYSYTPPMSPIFRYKVQNKLSSITASYSHRVYLKNKSVWLFSAVQFGLPNGILQPPIGSIAIPVDSNDSLSERPYFIRQYYSLSFGVEFDKIIINDRLELILIPTFRYLLPKLVENKYILGYTAHSVEYNMIYFDFKIGIRYSLKGIR
jgi:hypothetical protein